MPLEGEGDAVVLGWEPCQIYGGEKGSVAHKILGCRQEKKDLIENLYCRERERNGVTVEAAPTGAGSDNSKGSDLLNNGCVLNPYRITGGLLFLGWKQKIEMPTTIG